MDYVVACKAILKKEMKIVDHLGMDVREKT